MRKLICLLLMLLMTSGCCELFGICTSVHVHTSASSPDKFASSDLHYDSGLVASREPEASAESGMGPASAVVANPYYLLPD
jgi:hypothetical protein